jgi:hypothetical protein
LERNPKNCIACCKQVDRLIGNLAAMDDREPEREVAVNDTADMIRQIKANTARLGVPATSDAAAVTTTVHLDRFVLREAKASSAESSTPAQGNNGGSLLFSSSWRVFPPPAAHPRHTKKKHRKKLQQQHKEGDNNWESKLEKVPRSNHEGNNQQQENQEQRNSKKELWQEKRQQYQYTYPYRVGDRVIVMIPQQQQRQHQTEKRREDGGCTSGVGIRKNKKQKNSVADDDGIPGLGDTTDERRDKNKSKINHHNSFVPVPGIVFQITQEENGQRGNMIHVRRLDLSASGGDINITSSVVVVVSPKEQRKRLCPDLSVPIPMTVQTPIGARRPLACSVVLVEETLPFRQIVRFQLHNHRRTKDRVLEIGCSTGELSKMVWKNHFEVPPSSADDLSASSVEEKGPSWIGMDHSQEMIDRCQEQLDHHKALHASTARSYASKVVKIDALAEPKRASKEATTPTELFGPCPTVVLIDIGGNRECGPVIKTLIWVLMAFGGIENSSLRMVIVKSRALVRQLLSDCGNSGAINDRNNNNSNSNHDDIPTLDALSGIISRGTEWFDATHHKLLLVGKNRFERLFKHPLKAPKVMSPVNGTTPICRYHNYHKGGCRLYNDRLTVATHCPLDHDHCHACLQRGHVAKNCPRYETQSCY